MRRSWLLTAVWAVVLGLAPSATIAEDRHGRDDDRSSREDDRIDVGRAIAPVPLDLAGKNKRQVWLGSYIVNAQGGCNDCHTAPPYAEGGDPFQGQPEQINTAGYLCGGTDFEVAISADISPDEEGLPAGLERREFIRLLRTGEKPDGSLLQVMPWPIYGKMIRRDLAAVYAYLSAIPSCSAEP
jgi:hypothetical protein